MIIMILGSSGFLGSHLLDNLHAAGHTTVGLDIKVPRWSQPSFSIALDILDRNGLAGAFREHEPEAVVNLAGLLGTTETFAQPVHTIETNVIGALHVLECCRSTGARYVGIETGTTWRNPYAISKRCSTELAISYNDVYSIPVTVLKMFNAYGPRQDGTSKVNKVVPRFALNALRGLSLPIYGSGNQTIDLVSSSDCAEALRRAVEQSPGEGEVIEIGSGHGTTVLELAQLVLDQLGPGTLTFLPGRKGEGPDHPIADIARCQQLLAFAPAVDLSPLRQTLTWYREVGLDSLDYTENVSGRRQTPST